MKVLKGLEQRRDIEKYLFSNTAKSTSDPRKTGSLPTWMSNVSLSTAGTTSAVASGGNGSATATMSGNNRALTLALIDEAMKLAYLDGGQPDMLVMSPSNKVAFSDLSSGSVVTNELHMTSAKEASIIGSVSLYLTDFGTLNAVVDRYANDTEIYLMDSNFYSIGHLPNRMFKTIDIAPVGDATRFSLVSEWCLIMKAPKAHGAVYDLST